MPGKFEDLKSITFSSPKLNEFSLRKDKKIKKRKKDKKNFFKEWQKQLTKTLKLNINNKFKFKKRATERASTILDEELMKCRLNTGLNNSNHHSNY